MKQWNRSSVRAIIEQLLKPEVLSKKQKESVVNCILFRGQIIYKNHIPFRKRVYMGLVAHLRHQYTRYDTELNDSYADEVINSPYWVDWDEIHQDIKDWFNSKVIPRYINPFYAKKYSKVNQIPQN